MKRSIIIITILLLLTVSLNAQENKFFAGANSNFLMPIGSFSDRYESTLGGTVYFGQYISEDFAWIGKLEYMKFDELNTGKLFKKASLETGEGEQIYDIPLDKLEMEFQAITIGVEGKLKFIDSDFLKTSFSFGFGFANWQHKRETYLDTVYVVPAGIDTEVKLKEFNVPQNKQNEWSGVLSLGIDNDITIAGPLQLTLSGYYKVIIGELWPALALDIENVSGIQMIDLRAGIKYNF